MQTIAVLTALERAGLRSHPNDLFLGLSEPRKDGGRNALRDLLEPEGVRFTSIIIPASAGAIPCSPMWAFCRRRCSASTSRPFAMERPKPTRRSASAAPRMLRPRSVRRSTSPWRRRARASRSPWPMRTGSNASPAGGCSSGPRAWARTGTATVAAIGPVDQHSQLQLYLAGPNDKLFTVLTTDVAGKGPLMDEKLAKRAGEPGFGDKRLGDLVAAQAKSAYFVRLPRPAALRSVPPLLYFVPV